MENIHPFYVSSIKTDVFRIFVSKIFRGSRGIASNVFANILMSMPPEIFGPLYQSGFQLNPGKIGIAETIALLDLKI